MMGETKGRTILEPGFICLMLKLTKSFMALLRSKFPVITQIEGLGALEYLQQELFQI